MKKLIIYLLTFAVAFVVLQVLCGLFLTLVYTPDISSAWYMQATAPSTTIFGISVSISSFIIAMISAAIAFLLTSRFQITKKGAQ